MLVTVIVITFPDAVDVDSTITSLAALSDPVPTMLSPTLRFTSPAVPLKPPNFADMPETLVPVGRVVVKVILVAGALL